MAELEGLNRDLFGIDGQFPINFPGKKITHEVDFLDQIENLENEIYDKLPPSVAMLEVDDLLAEANIYPEGPISLRNTNGDPACCDDLFINFF